MRLRVLVPCTFVAALAVPVPAGAQDADEFAAELRTVDVAYEDEAREGGFLTDNDLADLEDLVDRLSTSSAGFDVAVLGSAVTDVPSEQAFADDLLSALGGDGRVVVLSPAAIGVASDLDSPSEIERAVGAAEDAATDQQSLTAGVEAAANTLGVEPGSPSEGDSSEGSGDDSGGGSGAWIWILLGLLAIGVIGLFWWSSRRRRKAAATADAASIGEGERKVRELVEHASAVIVELADHIDLAGTPVAAQDSFRQGAAAFAGLCILSRRTRGITVTRSIWRFGVFVFGATLSIAFSALAAEQGDGKAPAFTAAELVALPARNWITNGGNLYNQRYSRLDRIKRSNVKDVKAVWRVGLNGSGVGPPRSIRW